MTVAAKFSALALLFGCAFPRVASACASCGCGDPTLTAMGAEKPFAGRLRLSLDSRYRTDTIGEAGQNQLALREGRSDIQAAWAPDSRVFLLLTMPILLREIRYVNLERAVTFGPGDLELRAKFFLWQDSSFDPAHLVAAIVGVKLPTAPIQHDAQGRRLPLEMQPGTGSADPIAGLAYSFFHERWSAYLSVVGTYATSGSEGFRASRSVRWTGRGQYQFAPAFAARAGVDVRFDGKDIEAGAPEADSGGSIWFASAELLFSPTTDLLIAPSLKMPVLDDLSGHHREGPITGLSVAVDL